jgi:D-alanyl-D-alanine carboxypeptidase/D-alanyl-D-alanine-endopeptidase (penicillin-binding protein 4)
MHRKLSYIFILIIIIASNATCNAAVELLPAELKQAIEQRGFETGGIGLYIRATDNEKPLVVFQANKALNPASVAKVITTAAALSRLGAGYRWSTEIWYTGTIRNNTLEGDLYFVGNGDPYLTPERFWRLLNRIKIFGIEHINGNVYFDSTYFDPEPIDYAAFDEQPFRTYNVGPNAFLVGFQATEFHFDVVNGTVVIKPFPASQKIKVVNNVKAGSGRCVSWQKRLTLATEQKKDYLQVTIGGRFARSCGKRTMYRRVSGAEDHFQHFFLPLWQQIGGSLQGDIKPGRVPRDAQLALEHGSVTLAEAVRLINKFSNNVMTRQVLLTLGAKEFEPPGTTAKGIVAIKRWLAQQQLQEPSLVLDNGAGLSRETRVTARFLGELLYNTFYQGYMPEFIASLPVSGYDGTMAHRFRDTPLQGHAHIKTGLLDFVQSMAGYVTTADGKRYVVVMLHNDKRAHTRDAARLQDDIIQWVYNLK